ncbi:ABC transporter permease [Acuticoccus sp. I52.16.1]|uniref:ABC transporter permease n=1 Tax=Acuticoccus sp. I52.16.1 TaxID=2928472 RepID=UPI001FD1EF7F|nr:ABC transporter permease [Acuticoccus sp. I52.16.1]UOM32708.1 ABC transporter permease [Acuticoccus sp. I52.16.1]
MAGAVHKVRWALVDIVEWVARVIWPAPLRGALGWALLAPALVLVGILVIGLGQMLETSLHELNLATYRLGEAYTAANYVTALERPVTWRVLARTLGGAGIVTLVTLLLAFPYAYLLVRTPSAWTRKILLVALFLPFFIGQVVRAYGWLIILGREGLMNDLLRAAGLPAQDFLFAYPTVLFGLVQYMLPFAVLLVIPALTAIGEEVELASESLGARWPSTFRHVVLPMAAPGLIGASVVVFTLTLTDFAMPEILGGGTQDFFASAIYDSFFQISNAGLGAALSILLTLIGSVIVAAVFMVAGTGTLGFRGAK